LGGLSKAARRRIARLAADLSESGAVVVAQGTTFKPGTRLIREWKGEVHEVVICEAGYIWSGKHYRSLSRIARHHWYPLVGTAVLRSSDPATAHHRCVCLIHGSLCPTGVTIWRF
jgi:hypothetical protein